MYSTKVILHFSYLLLESVVFCPVLLVSEPKCFKGKFLGKSRMSGKVAGTNWKACGYEKPLILCACCFNYVYSTAGFGRSSEHLGGGPRQQSYVSAGAELCCLLCPPKGGSHWVSGPIKGAYLSGGGGDKGKATRGFLLENGIGLGLGWFPF